MTEQEIAEWLDNKLIESFRDNFDINARDNGGHTLLHYVIWHGYIDIVRILLDNGADINARDNSGRTPLHYAIIYGYIDIVRILLNNGADINAKNNNGWTTYTTPSLTQ